MNENDRQLDNARFFYFLLFCFPIGVGEEIGQKVSASANYLGSMFSNAWSKTAKTANDATANSSSFFSSAFTKVAAGKIRKRMRQKKTENRTFLTWNNIYPSIRKVSIDSLFFISMFAYVSLWFSCSLLWKWNSIKRWLRKRSIDSIFSPSNVCPFDTLVSMKCLSRFERLYFSCGILSITQ